MAKRVLVGVAAGVMFAGAAMAGPVEDANVAMERGDYATALRLARPLAEQGDADAEVLLGLIYGNGKGVSWDAAEAVKWYRLAAEQGVAVAQLALGAAYFSGVGVPQDYADAVKWARLAADQGNAKAQFLLGSAYALGHGVPQNTVMAHMWLNLAAAQGLADAVATRDVVAGVMTPEQMDGLLVARHFPGLVKAGDCVAVVAALAPSP